jgi:hypothetical protein
MKRGEQVMFRLTKKTIEVASSLFTLTILNLILIFVKAGSYRSTIAQQKLLDKSRKQINI